MRGRHHGQEAKSGWFESHYPPYFNLFLDTRKPILIF